MKPRQDVPESLLALASTQGGVLTRAQIDAHLGRSPLRRLVGAGAWRMITPGVYAVGGNEPADVQWWWAGHLIGGRGSALGGWSALAQAGLAELRCEGAASRREAEVWIPRGRRRQDRDGLFFRVDNCGRLDHRVGSLPRIRLEEALIDVGQTLEVEDWVGLLAEAARRGLVALPRVHDRLAARSRVGQRTMLTEVVRDLEGIESTLEWVYRRDVERAHGLPEGSRQVRVVGRWRCDVRYDSFFTIVEVDGAHHLRQADRDARRDNAHALRQETTLRYDSADIRGQPCRVASEVAAALTVRGWTRTPKRCPRCPAVDG
ncbi:MAG: type IV toxin-antitoxin system AbiEi family antitoxin domain-containing protein [Propioniciclava sp.]|uniref:type IV toxin-antitoxin system AbiEi family antitoxin domain-containing protein n=1 Tax=Propioniciclava sp. TaxID=2038686 RepID=UPI0039E6D196